ncbi:hypothetical protein NEOKW01_2110, partial [Nematocida sp. AWRm80]
MKYKIYICLIITFLYIQLYRQSSGANKKQKKNPDQCISMETDKCIQERAIDSTNRYIQPNEASWQSSLINERYMYYRYVQPMQYNQYGYSVQSAWPVEQNNAYNLDYSTNTSYNRKVSRKRARAEQTPNTIDSIDTNNSMNAALDMRVPYNTRRAEQSNIDIAIAGTSAADTNISDSADILMDIKSIKKYIHIEEEYIVINMYIFCKIRNLAILKKEIEKYKGNTVYIQYNAASILQKDIAKVMNNLFNKYSTIVVWSNHNKQKKTSQEEKPNTTLLGKFNRKRTEMQQFTERTDKYMNSEENKNKKRIVLYNMSIRCICMLDDLITNKDIISCYITKGDSE